MTLKVNVADMDNAPMAVLESDCFPFYVKCTIVDIDMESVNEKFYEIKKWLNENIGHRPQWSVVFVKSNMLDDMSFTFLFKLEEDVTAFKLRWIE